MVVVEQETAMQVEQVLRRLGPRATISHEVAAELWGIELLDAAVRRVTVPRDRSRVDVQGWQVRRRDLSSDEVVVVDGVRCTVPLRTLHDLALVLPLPGALVAADSALRHGLVSHLELVRTLGSRTGRGARGPRGVARLADPLSGSVLETLLRLLLSVLQPAPVSQYEVRDGRDLVARVDLCWPEHRLVVEADGFAFHSDRAAYRKDRQRSNQLERLGWRVLRFTWEDVVGRPDHVLDLVRACLQQRAA